MIQLYVQKQNDINKAQAGTLLSLAKTLGCEMQDLMERSVSIQVLSYEELKRTSRFLQATPIERRSNLLC
ncbi:MAG: hypothetical protein RRX92_02985 [Lachnospiraceae bacterium]